MPTARGSAAAVVDRNAIYVIGGNGATLRLDTVEKFVPATDTWTEEAPLLVGKSEPSAGLLGTTIVAAGGFTTSGTTGDTEAYDTTHECLELKDFRPHRTQLRLLRNHFQPALLLPAGILRGGRVEPD